MDEQNQTGLRVQTFGHFELNINGEVVANQSWAQRKSLQIFKFLVCQRGQVFTNDQLIDLFYPDIELDKATRNLQKRISEVRKILEPDLGRGSESNFIQRHGQSYVFSNDIEMWIDTEVFQSLVAEGLNLFGQEKFQDALGKLDAAIEIYKDDWLVEDLYEDWSTQLRDEFERFFLDALEHAASCHLALDDGQNALNRINEYLKKSPLVERVYRLKMEAHYALHDEQNIFQTYEDCKAMLQTKLDSDPSVETDQLLENLGKKVASRPAAERTKAERSRQKSLAVLPFVNMSADPENEYFSDGLTEELINAFTKIPGLRVTSRTSAFAFKNTSESIRHIGEQLGVTTVLEGSVRKSQDRLRITAQLINVEDDFHLWSDRFDRPFEDVFEIQDEISMAIVDGLKVELSGEHKPVIAHPTDNLDAYTHYLQGRFHWNKRTKTCLVESIECFKKAIEIDPNYAMAYAGIADAYHALALLEFMAPNDAFPKARQAVDSALAINASSAEAQTSLGWIHFIYEWDWPNAEVAFKKALDINPNYATAHHYYADLLKAMGRFDEAIAEIEIAQRRDPLSLPINTGVGHVLYLAQRYDDAIEQYRKTLEIDPNFVPTRLWFGRPYMQKGMFTEAIAEVKQAVDLSGGSSVALATLGHVYAVAGQTEEALKLLNQLLELSEEQYVPSYWVAMIYVGLGDMDNAYEWFFKAAEERSSWLAWVQVEPRFNQLRQDARYAELLEKMGFSV